MHELYQFEVAKIMHTLYHKEHPTNLTKFFTKSFIRHSRLTRSSESLMFTVPLMKSTKLQQSSYIKGLKRGTHFRTTSKPSPCLPSKLTVKINDK